MFDTHVLLQGSKVLPEPIKWGTPKTVIGAVVMALVFVLLIAVVASVVKRSRINNWKYKGAAVGNEDIFARLCDANQLSRREVFLLRKLVYDMRLQNPHLPFVDPTIYERYSSKISAKKRDILLALRDKIFA